MSHPLPSWNDGAARRAILDFVARVTAPEGPDFVPPAERIAVFDNDGTLWCEYPMQVQLFFTLAELKRMGAAEFVDHVEAWAVDARHPKTGRLLAAGNYRPQHELLDFLREHGFKTFIVTGGGVDFVRAVSERLYGIPPEQVVGSSTKYKVDFGNDSAEILKLPELGSFDDREEKVANIALHIGRRPIFAFGNSDGDLAMLRYTLAGKGASLGLLVRHDDPEREFAYDRDFKLSPLVEGLDKAADFGIQLVSMKNDWKAVFAA